MRLPRLRGRLWAEIYYDFNNVNYENIFNKVLFARCWVMGMNVIHLKHKLKLKGQLYGQLSTLILPYFLIKILIILII